MKPWKWFHKSIVIFTKGAKPKDGKARYPHIKDSSKIFYKLRLIKHLNLIFQTIGIKHVVQEVRNRQK